MRVVITGAGGQLGHDLVDAFADHEVFACDHAAMDVTDRDAVLGTILTVQPDAIIHAGAWTAVDACESDPDKAFRVNALGTRHVADAARRAGAHLVYVSTDYVFDGSKPEPYLEWDRTNPQSVYGRSKLGGELELGPESTIVRVAWVCGAHGNNFVKTMLRLAGERDSWGVVYDQRGCPTFTPDLAVGIRRLAVDRMPGVFHVTNQGATTWFDLARDVLRLAGFDPAKVHPISTVDYNAPAPRPANSVLENAALRGVGLPLLADYHEPLERLVKELLA
ncbi:MAG TPA: dTDP-4-dehydrorhamnose reductase [Acidimicrobiales bacterium]|nr:dTDP-4-dehydrorhamnose reductase [Acidimicrobiales bacterium]